MGAMENAKNSGQLEELEQRIGKLAEVLRGLARRRSRELLLFLIVMREIHRKRRGLVSASSGSRA